MQQSPYVKRALPTALALGLMSLASAPAQAIEFSSGEWSGSVDTTLSYGASWRLKDYEPEDVGKLAVLSGVWEFPMRVKCATLAWHTLRSALEAAGARVSTE